MLLEELVYSTNPTGMVWEGDIQLTSAFVIINSNLNYHKEWYTLQ